MYEISETEAAELQKKYAAEIKEKESYLKSRVDVMNRNVIDVSYHNGVIDWEKVKAAGVGGGDPALRIRHGSDRSG